MGLGSDFGERLKRARKAKGLTQTQVAELIDKSRDRVIAYEKGDVTLDMAEMLARAVGAPLEMLLFPMAEARTVDELLVRVIGVWGRLDESERRTIVHVAESLSKAKAPQALDDPPDAVAGNKKPGA